MQRHRPQHNLPKCVIRGSHDRDWFPHRRAVSLYCVRRPFDRLSRPLQGEKSAPIDRLAHVLAVQTHSRSSLSHFSMPTRSSLRASTQANIFQLSLQLLKSIARNQTTQTSTVQPLSTPPSPDTILQARTNT